MLITKSQIDLLLQHRFDEVPVTSFYLNVSPAANPKGEYLIRSKTLLKESREKLVKDSFSRDGYHSVMEDFDKIARTVESIKGHSFNSLALFSSSKAGFFQHYELEEPVNDRLIVDYFPYTKPLFAVIRLKQRFMALLFKKDKLRVFEIYGDRIREELDLFKTSLFSSRANAYIFTNEKKIQNRLETEYTKFLREAGAAVLDIVMKAGADFMVLGGDKNAARDFYKSAHSYLRDRFAGMIDVEFNAGEKDVLKEVKRISEARTVEKDRELVSRMREELARNGDVLTGLARVLPVISMGAVSILAIAEGYIVPGYMDRSSGLLYAEQIPSGMEKKNLIPVADVVNEAADAAILHGAEVRIIKNRELMSSLDMIAALLRYRVQ